MRYAMLYPRLFLVIFSVLVTREAYRLGLGDISSPGPGFMMFWAVALLGLLAVHLSVSCLVSRQKSNKHIWKGKELEQPVSIFVALLLYIILFKPLGYLLATFFLLVVLFRTPRTGKDKWLVIVGSAAITSFITYLVFCRGLALQLPQGIIHFF